MFFFSAALAEEGFTEFSTYDMKGNIVTQDVFSDYDLTVVNVWATWCHYCVYEMPELEKLKNMLPENVNFLTICDDAALELYKAADILKTAGADFQTLIETQEIYDQYLYQINIFPSTCFFDRNGCPVGTIISGLPSMENIAEAYYDITMQVLDSLEP